MKRKFLTLLAFVAITIVCAGQPVLATPIILVPDLSNFAVLGGCGTVTNTGATKLCGDLGISPGSAITGEACICVKGVKACVAGNPSVFKDCAVAGCAHAELAGVESCIRGLAHSCDSGALQGQIILPGVYHFATNALLPTGTTVTLCGNGCPNAFWIFCVGTCLTACSNSSVVVQNTCETCPEVLWNVGSSATIGTCAHFIGDLLACQSITLDTGAQLVDGSALALISVTMDNNNIQPGVPGNPAGGAGAPELQTDALTTPFALIVAVLLILGDRRRRGVVSG